MPKQNEPAKFGELAPSAYPGERLGLPEAGKRSVARVGRRIGAIFVDWAIALLLSKTLFSVSAFIEPLLTLGIFAVLQYLFIVCWSGSIGHLLFGMRVVPLVGGWVGLWRPAVRTILLCIVVPVLVWDSDQRAFHDKIAGTVLVRY